MSQASESLWESDFIQRRMGIMGTDGYQKKGIWLSSNGHQEVCTSMFDSSIVSLRSDLGRASRFLSEYLAHSTRLFGFGRGMAGRMLSPLHLPVSWQRDGIPATTHTPLSQELGTGFRYPSRIMAVTRARNQIPILTGLLPYQASRSLLGLYTK
jgi:hypothetical protein